MGALFVACAAAFALAAQPATAQFEAGPGVPSNPAPGPCTGKIANALVGQPVAPFAPPCVHPDARKHGQLIVFTTGLDLSPVDGGERGGINVVRADGTGLRKITNFVTKDFDFSKLHGLNLPDDHPAFSPNGRKIAFASNRRKPKVNGERDIFVMNANGSNPIAVGATDGLDTEPVFSPDGDQILFATERFSRAEGAEANVNLDIAVMNLDGSGVTRLTSSGLEDVEPAWSPDGTKIAFARTFRAGQKDVFVMNADGTDQHQITFADGEDHDPIFEGTGQTLLIGSERAPFSPPFGNVYRVNLSGVPVAFGDRVDDADGDLSDDLANAAVDAAPSPLGDRLAFFKWQLPIAKSPTALFVSAADGTGKFRIPAEGIVSVHPNWGVAADSDKDGTLDYLESGTVGRALLRSKRTLRAGRRQRLTLDWVHPGGSWRKLDTLRFELLDARGRIAAALRFVEDDGSVSLLNPRSGDWTPRKRLERRGRLRAGALTLDVRRSRASGVSRKRLRLHLSVQIARRAAGRYALHAEGSSDGGSKLSGGGYEELGRIARLRVVR